MYKKFFSVLILSFFVFSVSCSPDAAVREKSLLSGSADDWRIVTASLINSDHNPIAGTRVSPKQLEKVSGGWMLLYQGHYPGGRGPYERENLPALTSSPDFHDWKDDPANPFYYGEGPSYEWEGNRAMPEAFIRIDGEYYLYYGGSNPGIGLRGIGLARGSDLYSLQGQGPPLIIPNEKKRSAWNRDRVYCRGVYEIDETYYMVVSGGLQPEDNPRRRKYSMGIYLSDDGIHWSEYGRNPVFKAKRGSWYESGVVPKSPVLIDGLWYMAFESFIWNDDEEIEGRGIGLAAAESITGPWVVISDEKPVIYTGDYQDKFRDIEHPMIVFFGDEKRSGSRYGIIAAVSPPGMEEISNFEKSSLALWIMK